MFHRNPSLALGSMLCLILSFLFSQTQSQSNAEDQCNIKNSESNIKIPLIDLSTFDINNESHIESVWTALNTIGFFHLQLDPDFDTISRDILNVAKEFFALPLENKLRVSNDEWSRHYVNGTSIPGTGAGYRSKGFDVNFPNDTRESFNIGPNENTTIQDISSFSGVGINRWPDTVDNVFDGVRFKALVQEYSQKMLKISSKLTEILAVSLLGMEYRYYFERNGFFNDAPWILGFVHYFNEKSDEKNNKFGIRAHSDYGIFTLLLTDNQHGLQIQIDEEWKDVSPPQNVGHYLTVNIGKILEFWTNQRFKATRHRVVIEPDMLSGDRYAIPFFYEVNINAVIKPLFQYQHTGNPLDSVDAVDEITPAQLYLDRLLKSNQDFD